MGANAQTYALFVEPFVLCYADELISIRLASVMSINDVPTRKCSVNAVMISLTATTSLIGPEVTLCTHFDSLTFRLKTDQNV